MRIHFLTAISVTALSLAATSAFAQSTPPRRGGCFGLDIPCAP